MLRRERVTARTALQLRRLVACEIHQSAPVHDAVERWRQRGGRCQNLLRQDDDYLEESHPERLCQARCRLYRRREAVCYALSAPYVQQLSRGTGPVATGISVPGEVQGTLPVDMDTPGWTSLPLARSAGMGGHA